MISAALFDLDGTLFDTEDQYTRFWESMALRFRPDIPGLAHIIKGTTLKQIYSNYFPDPEVQKELTRLSTEYERDMRYDFIPGAEKFLRELRGAGVKLAVVTSSDRSKMQSVRANRPDFDTYFDRVLTSEDFARSKPAPDCYLLGAEVFGMDKRQCVVFEDAINGLKAAKASGIFTVGLATTNTAEAIEGLCDYIIKDFTEINYNLLNEITDKYYS